ncbi:hypothetical protein [Ligilactobacillus equi]|uniref:hypothetical protein n=1 Tax=Ligilactobacillus equi TaxID=137357 RepID=UPI00046AEE29|nr:hypothetical protein [Ligilactobacillus equi]
MSDLNTQYEKIGKELVTQLGYDPRVLEFANEDNGLSDWYWGKVSEILENRWLLNCVKEYYESCVNC